MPLMRHLIVFTLAYLGLTFGAAAQVDYDLVVPPEGAYAKTFPDYLVQRAWQNQGRTRALNAEAAIADLEVKQARWGWLDHINANLNFSSQQDSIYGRFGAGSPPDPGSGNPGDPLYVRPGFNYGLSLNLGGVLLNKQEVRLAEQQRIIAGSKIDQEKLQLRAIVVTRLETYDNARSVLRIRRQAEIDAETNYKLVQSLVEQGKAQFEDLAQASEVYHRSVEATAIAESRVRQARYALEEMTGETWDLAQVVRDRMEVDKG